jgi:hypothetical protein
VGTKPLKDFNEGEQVRYFADTSGKISTVITPHSDIATVLEKQTGFVMLAWKPGDTALLGVSTVGPQSSIALKGFDRVIWVPDVVIGEEVISAKITQKQKQSLAHSNGMFCGRCNDHNPWAEPNTADGKYMCYGCRGRK